LIKLPVLPESDNQIKSSRNNLRVEEKLKGGKSNVKNRKPSNSERKPEGMGTAKFDDLWGYDDFDPTVV
jgi:hypothetical protein